MSQIKVNTLFLYLGLSLSLLLGESAFAELSDIQQIDVGCDHTCAVTTGGAVKCWGHNDYGQLGDGTTTDRAAPTLVSGLTNGVAAVSAELYHTCALTTSGGVKCWGSGEWGKLGNGTGANSTTPVDVIGLTGGVAAISAGTLHTCALTTTGGMKCWGSNYSGQLGDGTGISSAVPVDVPGLISGVASIGLGHDHTCALTTSGGVKCWGWNAYGAIGDGTTTERHTPVDVVGLQSGVVEISAGGYHNCALTASGGVKCWGASLSAFGNTATDSRLTPVDVSGLTGGVVAIDAGLQFDCALTTSGGVKCWGNNFYGQLGNGNSGIFGESLTPVDVIDLQSGVGEISAGGHHTCALTTSGGAKCWGRNSYGEVGDGTTTERHIPTSVLGRYFLAGTISLNGSALQGVAVTDTSMGTQTTDELGWYLFPNIPENTAYAITPSKAGYAFSPQSVGATVVSDVIENFTAALDGCPDDPDKTAPGVCGCGVPDTDSDNDEMLDCNDACPQEDSRGFDTDGNGCLDTLSGLGQIIATLPPEALSAEIKTSLAAKVNAAQRSFDKDVINAAIQKLDAFINELEAQAGKAISTEAAAMLTKYAQSVIAQLQQRLSALG